jgi:hypothetical protein
MNPVLLAALAEEHVREVRRHTVRDCPGIRPWRRLRTGVGFVLVETGLRLLAT